MLQAFFRHLINLFEKEWGKGIRIDGYIIERCIGKGSYGTAYLVQHESTGEWAVLKRIRLYKKLFERNHHILKHEVRVLNDLVHPSIPKVLQQGEFQKVPYFIMEWMNGETFEEFIFRKGKVYTEEESLIIGLKIIEIVKWVHCNGYVHRDLRIPNILMKQEVIQLIDFGLAAKMNPNEPIIENTYRDHMRAKHPQSDYYALGHFLLFLLYSGFVPENKKELSWEDELTLSSNTKAIIRKLLRIQGTYDSAEEIILDIKKSIHMIQKRNVNI